MEEFIHPVLFRVKVLLVKILQQTQTSLQEQFKNKPLSLQGPGASPDSESPYQRPESACRSGA